ncbi:MAG: protein meaA [Candidatus Mycalebacterium zealandia]|nr:MAG: protein meaA [Candidatus Mycalebacterium zealandia]
MSPRTKRTNGKAPQTKDRPWIMRTYAGHSTAKASNELYRKNLKKGQTGLSVAFDLPTQTGYDSDSPLAEGEVGKVGVPICHIEDMATLFDHIPLEKMNTSMTINATAAWLLALYIAVAEKRGTDSSVLQGTTQNDIIKEYLSRGTYIFPPAHSMRLISDMVTHCYRNVPKWNPINICSYHLQEAGATPVQEIAYTISNAVAVLDAVRDSGAISKKDFPGVVGRVSFFVNAGIRFVEEVSKLRAFTEIWDDLTKNRYGVKDENFRRFRYGVQVNSLGLAADQPENNVARIILQMLDVTLSKKARARAIQLPAWNEALGLPRPWDQQWSLRFQQILAFETDILEYPDIFDGSKVINAKSRELKKNALAEAGKIADMGGALESIEYMKESLVASNALRIAAIESGDIMRVGVNCFTETEQSPLTKSLETSIHKTSPGLVRDQINRLVAFKKKRKSAKVKKSLSGLSSAARNGQNIMPASIECARAGVTTGEWADTLRKEFGEYRAPTGASVELSCGTKNDEDKSVRVSVKKIHDKLGRPPKILIGKPGLDGHSNGAEQIAVRARDMGMEVLYQGIRLTPEQIVSAAEQENVDLIGLSILSGSHNTVVPKIMKMLKSRGMSDVPVIMGGIIPDKDAKRLMKSGVKKVYTPKDFSLTQIMDDIAGLVLESRS